ncbi:MAG: S-methyl-5-thioribose-1-phosphate isomerase [Zoogloeaceae bacterium]|jgi:methylthioribose-1-phosphate isomerase|nr:S-methyl-5-thioribose-1-phosphate isomerase [Zoogloeaceae bacterium]
MNAPLSTFAPDPALASWPFLTPSPIRLGTPPEIAILDQTALPHMARWLSINDLAAAVQAIARMQVRGAPLIGIVAACGVALAMFADPGDAALDAAVQRLAATRPTAVNLQWALNRMRAKLQPLPPVERAEAAWREARALYQEDAQMTASLGLAGLNLLRDLADKTSRPLSLMTHCNAGWLATSANGTALAPIYAAHAAGLPVVVRVSETRPRAQGWLTAWELHKAGVPHSLFADNAAGFLLAQGQVDAVIVGADRIAANGDVANKVGTLLKALAARRFGVPFYVAAPSSTFDAGAASGADFVIETRAADELRRVQGRNAQGEIDEIILFAADELVDNPAFDVTFADLITGFISERGVFASAQAAFVS